MLRKWWKNTCNNVEAGVCMLNTRYKGCWKPKMLKNNTTCECKFFETQCLFQSFGLLLMKTWWYNLNNVVSNITVCTNKAMYQMSKNDKIGLITLLVGNNSVTWNSNTKEKTLQFHAGIKHKLTNITWKGKGKKHMSLSPKSGLSKEKVWEQQGTAGNSVRMCAEASGPSYLLLITPFSSFTPL